MINSTTITRKEKEEGKSIKFVINNLFMSTIIPQTNGNKYC